MPNETMPNGTRSVADWTVDDVCDFLAAAKLTPHADSFRTEGVDGAMLLECIQEEGALQELGVHKALERARLKSNLNKELTALTAAFGTASIGDSKMKVEAAAEVQLEAPEEAEVVHEVVVGAGAPALEPVAEATAEVMEVAEVEEQQTVGCGPMDGPSASALSAAGSVCQSMAQMGGRGNPRAGEAIHLGPTQSTPAESAPLRAPDPTAAPPRRRRNRAKSKGGNKDGVREPAPLGGRFDSHLPKGLRYGTLEHATLEIYGAWRAGKELTDVEAQRLVELLRRVLARPPGMGGPQRALDLTCPTDCEPQDDPDDLGLVRSSWDYDNEQYDPPEFTLDEDAAATAHRQRVLQAEGWPGGEMPSVGQLRAHMLYRVEAHHKNDLKVFGRPRPTFDEWEAEAEAAHRRQQRMRQEEEEASNEANDCDAADDLAADAAAAGEWA